MKPWKTVY